MAKSEDDVCAADGEKKVSITCSTQRGILLRGEGAMRPCCKQTCHTELLINSAGTTQQEAKAEYLSLSCGEYIAI